jgi:hypothetical protein
MDKWTFGITLTLVGISGTFITLWILSLVIIALKKLFPPRVESSSPDKSS